MAARANCRGNIMELDGTKKRILEAALELFSVKGYESTSLSQIAEAVGIRKASLYSHFESKQEILDVLIGIIVEQYSRHSFFLNMDWDDDKNQKILDLTPEQTAKMVQEQIRYIVHNPLVSMGRKMLVIEQFQNPDLAKLQSVRNYDDIMKYHTTYFQKLIDKGIIKNSDPEILAAQYCLPINVWLNLVDREPEKEEMVMKLIEKHILQFFDTHKK